MQRQFKTSIIGFQNKFDWAYIAMLALLHVSVSFFLWNTVKIEYLSDGEFYNGIAQALLEDSTFINQIGVRNHGDEIGQMLMPGFSYLLFVVYQILGNDLMNFVGFQLLLSGISIIVFFLLIKRYCKSLLAFVITALLVLFVEIWRFNFSGMMEATTVSFLIITTYLLDDFIRHKKWINILAFSILAFVLVAINNRFILHVFFSYLILIIASIKSKPNLLKVVLGGALFVLLMLPWHIRQYRVYDKFVLFGPERDQFVKDVPIQEEITFSYDQSVEFLKIPSVDRMDSEVWLPLFSQEKYQQLIEESENRNYKLDRFMGFFEVIRTDFRLGFGNRKELIYPPNIYGKKQLLILSLNLFVFGLGFILLIPSIYYSIRNRNIFGIIAFAFFIAHVFVHTYVLYIPRYRLTITPVMLILTSFGLLQLKAWKEQLFKSSRSKLIN